MFNKPPTIYVPQEPTKRDPISGQRSPLYDLSPALKFGSLKVLLPHGIMLLNTTPIVETLKRDMADFCDEDYVMCIGDPSAIAAAVMVASSINEGRVKLLKYSREEKLYNLISYVI